ncbi:MAG: putative manganese transporter [Candidatus Marinimicrobia bacterium]|nr:putative manganese transporter [Candidatus Neomarinimicrobiota bacterium]
MSTVVNVFKHAIMITGFVFTMMLIIEYINVQTKGLWQENISQSVWKQYFLSAILGAIPGCLGAFTAVTLFSHRLISLGALVTAMIATSGDEAFVMLSMFPQKAIFLTLIIMVVGIVAGFITDKLPFSKSFKNSLKAKKLPIHKEEKCKCVPENKLFENMENPSIQRILLIVIVSIFLIGTVLGEIGPPEWNWVRITILLVSSVSLFIITTVPEHFLLEHLWNHIVKIHIPRIFLWIFGTLFVMQILMQFIDINSWIAENMYILLAVAVLIGIVPESGPHMIFVTLFASGTIPFSILLASSIVQDGHGMLPLLAESKKGFLSVKLINMIVGAIVGVIGLTLGF